MCLRVRSRYSVICLGGRLFAEQHPGGLSPHKTKGCSRLHSKVFLSNKHPGHWRAKINKIGARCANFVIVLSRGRSCRLFKECLLLRNHQADEVASASFSSLTCLCVSSLSKILFRLQELLIQTGAPLGLHLRNQPGQQKNPTLTLHPSEKEG